MTPMPESTRTTTSDRAVGIPGDEASRCARGGREARRGLAPSHGGWVNLDDDLKALERRMELDRQRLPIEEEARKAQAVGDHARAAGLWTQSLELARRGGDDVSRWYVEGQLAEVLIESGQIIEAKKLLEASLRAGNDLPIVHSQLMNIYMEERSFEAAFRVQHDAWQSVTTRARRNGMPPIDPSPQIVGFAKWWKETDSEQPIMLAEKWAEEAQARSAWFAVRHERAQFLEKQGAENAALDLYLDLIRQGSQLDASYTRSLMLLDRAKRFDEALALARAIPGLGLSASLEEQARKRIARLEAKMEKSQGHASRTRKPAKTVVPAFSIRSGESALRWIGQLEVKGGISSIVSTPAGVYATGGTEPALWWIATGAEPTRLRSITKRTRFHCSQGAALVTDEGTVKDGRAHVEILGQDWATVAAVDLPGVISEVAPTTWGIALGCRGGGLYALGWDGAMRWRFDVPERPESSPFGRACPYFVSSAPGSGTIVISTYGEVYALTGQGDVAWTWRLTPPREHGLVVITPTIEGEQAPAFDARRPRGPGAEELSNKNEEEILQIAISSLSAIFKMTVPEIQQRIVASKVFNWFTERYAQGAYSYPYPSSKEAKRIMNKPVDDTIFFAGEALYSKESLGTVEAALVSGKEVAAKVKKTK